MPEILAWHTDDQSADEIVRQIAERDRSAIAATSVAATPLPFSSSIETTLEKSVTRATIPKTQKPPDRDENRVPPPPEIPAQGYGPHFEIGDDGVITFAPPDALDRQGNNVARLKKLHPTLRALSSDLAEMLGAGNIPHWYLRDRAENYRAVVNQDIERIDFSKLYVEGLRLANAEKAGRSEKELPPLPPPIREAIDTLLQVHGTFVLATAEGLEAIAAEERYRRTPQQEAQYRTAAIGFAQSLQDKPEVIDPKAASFVLGTTEEIGRGTNPERSSTVASGTVKNVAITVSTAATLAALSAAAIASGVPVLIVGAGATVLVVGEGLKKSKPFAAVAALVTKGLDKTSEAEVATVLTNLSERLKPQLRFILTVESQLRGLAGQRDEFKWVLRSLDWIKQQVPGDPIGNSPEGESATSREIQRGTIGLPDGKFSCFRDVDAAPEMIVVPAGTFLMGSRDGEGDNDERPQHKVTVGSPFAVGRFAVTFHEWDAAYGRGGVEHNPGDEGWGRGRRPVINVSWEDATAYVGWLSRETGKSYRLLSEAEWEYCCRAGTTTAYSFGDTIDNKQAQFSALKTIETGSFPANAWGLHEMHGNVWEWCKDKWHPGYGGAPEDGSAWTADGATSRVVTSRVLRGGTWNFDPQNLRSTYRSWDDPGSRSNNVGFRVARTL